MIEPDRDHVQSLERGLAVLLAFDAEHPEPTLAELAQLTGFSRPAVRRFLITLERLGLPGSSCLFVDDVDRNCEGAEALGITAVHFRENEQAIPEIRSALGA